MRIKEILNETVCFATCFKSIEAMPKSSHSDDDKIRLATAMLNKIKVQHPREEVRKPFIFLKCWEIVRHLPKFAAVAGCASSSDGDTNARQAKSSADQGHADQKD